jgi:hypothetical protein
MSRRGRVPAKKKAPARVTLKNVKAPFNSNSIYKDVHKVFLNRYKLKVGDQVVLHGAWGNETMGFGGYGSSDVYIYEEEVHKVHAITEDGVLLKELKNAKERKYWVPIFALVKVAATMKLGDYVAVVASDGTVKVECQTLAPASILALAKLVTKAVTSNKTIKK